MAKKWILFLALSPLIIFYSGCTASEKPSPSIVGIWWAASGGGATDCTLTIGDDASLIQTYEQGGGSNLQVGTLSPADMPADTTLTYTLSYKDGPAVPPFSTYYLRYSNLTDTTVDLEIDVGGGWEAVGTLQRQTSSIVGTWSCASMGLMTNVVMTINADCSFSVSYQWGGSNTQTGGFHPYTMNADTDLGAVVATSSGPNAPPGPYPVTITIASPAVITWTDNGKSANDRVAFASTGELPFGLDPGTIYYVVGSSLTVDTFEVSSTPGGAAVDTSGTQSGTHTGLSVWLMKYTNLTATTVDISIDMGSGYSPPFTFTKS